jgi:uncharacterized damage-inducible protein DinB
VNRERLLASRLADHQASLREYIAKARGVSPDRWLTPRAEGKWTPAQETRHLVLAYDAFLRDLAGTGKMGLRGTPFKRRLWRLIWLTLLLWRKRLPVGARAAREARPEWETTGPDALLFELNARALELEAALSRAWRDEPDRTLTHPYFGDLTLDQSLQMLTVHNRHHAAFLP